MVSPNSWLWGNCTWPLLTWSCGSEGTLVLSHEELEDQTSDVSWREAYTGDPFRVQDLGAPALGRWRRSLSGYVIWWLRSMPCLLCALAQELLVAGFQVQDIFMYVVVILGLTEVEWTCFFVGPQSHSTSSAVFWARLCCAALQTSAVFRERSPHLWCKPIQKVSNDPICGYAYG